MAETIESALAQTRLPDEVVVVDDGSTDATPEILRDYPVRVVRQENGGEASARNRGVAEARGDLVAFLDHDDLWAPQKLERQLDHIAGCDVSFTDCLQQAPDGARELHPVSDWRADQALESFARHYVIWTPSSVLVRRAVLPPFEQVEPFGDDWLMWLRLAATGRLFTYLAEPLTIHRIHSSNLSRDSGDWLPIAIFEKFGNPSFTAFWHLEAAIAAERRSERRQHVFAAARARPASIRPGWARLLV